MERRDPMLEFSSPAATLTGPDDSVAARDLFAALYHELHRLAHYELNRDGARPAIGATTLLHELYLSFSNRDTSFSDKGQFFAYAARAMRGLIVDATRRHCALKRGGSFEITRLSTNYNEAVPDQQEITRIDEALEELASVDATLVELVDLKYFSGLSLAEIGALRGVTERTMQREWRKARLLLFHLLTGDEAA
jgi:RNA polymerase sigma factor (TIGR02999 family)